ncbi:MAG: AbrB/MazE/SpoVT family DNA-binding domain-containing protein [Candidatus Geothermarchaeales archaeon]
MTATEKLFKVKMSTKGQLVIPKNLRDAYGLREGDSVLLIPRGEGLLIKRYEVKGEGLRGLLKDLEVDVEECEAILEEAKRTIVKV